MWRRSLPPVFRLVSLRITNVSVVHSILVLFVSTSVSMPVRCRLSLLSPSVAHTFARFASFEAPPADSVEECAQVRLPKGPFEERRRAIPHGGTFRAPRLSGLRMVLRLWVRYSRLLSRRCVFIESRGWVSKFPFVKGPRNHP